MYIFSYLRYLLRLTQNKDYGGNGQCRYLKHMLIWLRAGIICVENILSYIIYTVPVEFWPIRQAGLSLGKYSYAIHEISEEQEH